MSNLRSYTSPNGNLELSGYRDVNGKARFTLNQLVGEGVGCVFEDQRWADCFHEVARRFPDPIWVLSLVDPVVGDQETEWAVRAVEKRAAKVAKAQSAYNDAVRYLAKLRDGLEVRG